jgi:hypothetical protein
MINKIKAHMSVIKYFLSFFARMPRNYVAFYRQEMWFLKYQASSPYPPMEDI